MISLVGVQSWILLFQKLQVVQREDFRRAYHLLGKTVIDTIRFICMNWRIIDVTDIHCHQGDSLQN
ncbi:hypothetical protein DPMN_085090 [Dreissena polymorpha]|uniref:Uncharacterized protein n=1 Tax=Dreissena polymorpha TaxID=45954 RepID=A0A9D3YD04_DREPO|nr:hypothetical protein DPMN_085090 [Dreissena polymorpha]